MPSGVYIRTEEHLARLRTNFDVIRFRGEMSEVHKHKIGDAQLGEKNHNWKGNKAGYQALHIWIRNTLGKATKCSNGHIARQYVWANISGEYKREISDWHELCKACNLTDGVPKANRFLKGDDKNG